MVLTLSANHVLRSQAVAPVVVWDGDDTLWFVERLYDEARAAVAELVRRHGLDADAWDQAQRTIDVENVYKLGLSRLRFPTSCVEALDQIAAAAGRVASPELRDEAWKLADAVFSASAPLAEHVRDVLSSVREIARMVLVTKGDPTVQVARIATSGLGEFFDSVLIVSDKTVATYRAVADMCGVRPSDCWSVGNSLPSDINPAVSAGMKAIWVDAHVWDHERRETVPTHEVRIAASLKEAGEVLLDEL